MIQPNVIQVIEESEFSEFFIKFLYANTLQPVGNVMDITYRTTEVEPVETPHAIAAPEELDHLMKHYIGQVTTSSYSLSAIEVAVMAYKRFLDIYPFEKNNEETAMAIAAYIFARAGYEFHGIPDELSDAYKAAIIEAQKTGMPDQLIQVFTKSLLD